MFKRVLLLLPLLLLAIGPIALPAMASNDDLFEEQWALKKVEAEKAWATSAGNGMVVAVLDTGVDFTHPDLAGQSAGSFDCVESGCQSRVSGDPQGHGTHVAGIIAAVTGNGRGVASVAPGAKILNVRVLNEDGVGQGQQISRGIRLAADKGAHVINMSLGTPESPVNDTIDFSGDFDYAWNKGTIIVVAAGNDAGLASSYALSQHALVVGATGAQDERATYSTGSYNPVDVDIYAPGGNGSPCNPFKCVLSTVPNGTYDAFQGTSMAAPHVAGVAALVRCTGLTKEQTVDRVVETADRISAGPRVNAAKAVAGLKSTSCAASFAGAAPASANSPAAKATAAKPAAGSNQTAPPAQAQTQPGATKAEEAPQTATALSANEDEKSNRTAINIGIGAGLALIIAAWYGWTKFKARRAAAP